MPNEDLVCFILFLALCSLCGETEGKHFAGGAVDNLINRAFQGYVAVMFYVFFMEFATTGRPVELECPLPDWFQAVLRKLEAQSL